MIRLTIEDNGAGADTVVRLRIEGRITRDTVGELRNATAAITAGRIEMDLLGVRFVDTTGAQTLRDLEANGVALVGGSQFLRSMLSTSAGGDAGDGREGRLIERLRAGDPPAYEEIVRLHGGRMLATARRLLRSEEDARDAVQDAFLSAFKGVASFAGQSMLSTWLHRITVNAALMKLRSKGRRPEQPLDELLPVFDERGHWASDEREWSIPGEQALQRRETRELVRRCIDQLPERYRTALLLRDIEELDTEEVAAILGVNSNTVKIRVHRARQALRALIAQAVAAG